MLMQGRQRDVIKVTIIQVRNLGRRCIRILFFDTRHAAIACPSREGDVDLLEDVVAVVVHSAVYVRS
jgi:hypothetical protein